MKNGLQRLSPEIEISPLAFLVVDETGRYVDANPAALVLFRIERDQLLGLTIRDMMSADSIEFGEAHFRDLLETGRVDVEVKMKRGDGTELWVKITAARLSDGRLGAFHEDVSDLRQAARELQDSRDNYRSILKITTNSFFKLDREGRFIEFNDSLCEMLDYSREELQRLRVSDIEALETKEDTARHLEKLTQVSSERFETRWRSKDGHVLEVDVSTTWVPDMDGDGRFVCFGRDITERRQLTSELVDLRMAVEQSANTIVITDVSGIILYVNPAFEKNTGYSLLEVFGQNVRILKSGQQDKPFYRRLWKTIIGGGIWQGVFHNRRKDGSLFWESATISPIFEQDGKIHRFIAVKEDITARKKMEDSLKDYTDELQEVNAELARNIRRSDELAQRAECASQAKSEFLAVMSHELRSPLNGVLGFAQLLESTSLDSEQTEYAKMIYQSGKHLLDVVNEILDFSSIEKGRMAVDRSLFCLTDVVESACKDSHIASLKKGIEFSREIAENVDQLIMADQRRIGQILGHLLSNAVKFTTAGSVSLRVCKCQAEGRTEILFKVTDTGQGIAPEAIPQLFQPFSQGDSSLRRKHEGTGLGLAISKRIAEAMEGEITVESQIGRGSTFTFRFPIGPVPAQPIAPLPKKPVQEHPDPGALVLVVEDSLIGRVLAEKLLHNLGYRVEFATNGQEAVDVFVSGKYAVILMDMQMPVMDGIEATRQIRGKETPGHRVQIVAITANVMPGDRERCFDVGMDDFLSKPFTKSEFMEKLRAAKQRSDQKK